MQDKIIPFRRRGEQKPAEHTPVTEPAMDVEEGWTLVKIIAQAPPSTR